MHKGEFDIPPTHIQTYAFKWTIEHLKRKLEHPITKEKIDAAEPVLVKDANSDGNQMSLALTFSVDPNEECYSYHGHDYAKLNASLLKKSMTCSQEVVICWSVTLESQDAERKKMEYKLQKDTVTITSKELMHNGDLYVRNFKESVLYNITLYIEVIWPEKYNIAKARIAEADHMKGMTDLLTSGKFSDIKVICKDKQFDCHKVILATQSAVFEAMFSNEDLLETKQGVVTIKDMEPEELEAFLKFVYIGKFDDEVKQHSRALLAAGDKYNVQDLMALAEEELIRTMNLENVIDLFVLAHMHNVQDLKKTALTSIITNFDQVSKQAKWKELKDSQCDMVELIEMFVGIGKL